MFFNSIVPTPKGTLLPQQILELTTIFLESTSKSSDSDIVLILCHHAEAILSQIKRSTKKSATTAADSEDQAQRERVAEAYFNLGRLMDDQEYREEAKAFYKKAQKLE
ncbi:hypothetical protein B0O80DRAFT_430693 [Mortierella sp. GBAus27b]|nr:hypothetical protein B0O80DRAFT_430693 [Mortierella sp. GBAus27b]